MFDKFDDDCLRDIGPRSQNAAAAERAENTVATVTQQSLQFVAMDAGQIAANALLYNADSRSGREGSGLSDRG